MLRVSSDEWAATKDFLNLGGRDTMFPAFCAIAVVPVEAVRLQNHRKGKLVYIHKYRQRQRGLRWQKRQQRLPLYFPASSFFTVSLTSLPSTRAPTNLAMTFFITAPMSFIVGAPISAMVVFTAAVMSASLTALGM